MPGLHYMKPLARNAYSLDKLFDNEEEKIAKEKRQAPAVQFSFLPDFFLACL